MSKQRWLITGAAGFVGAHVCRDFLKRGHEVCGVDNLSAGGIKNIEDLLEDDRFHFLEKDIRDPSLATAFESFKPTHVLHLAACVSVPLCEQDPAEARSVNVSGFDAILALSAQAGVKTFLYASSSAVYGNLQRNLISEQDPAEPIGVYGQSKLENEKSAARLDNDAMKRIGFRFFNLFGPSKNKQSSYAAVIPLWVAALRSDEQAIIYGDGNATRDFCYIQNVLHALHLSEKCPAGNHVMNIGTGIPTTLNTLYYTLCETLGVTREPLYQPWRPTDIVHSCANIEHAQKLMGYEPQVMLAEGLALYL
ncbi:MAG: NAD-dependent epimerase/dehydratase family protein [Gammaproteobacteria bacterium]